jgi:hypothetical protein
MGALQGCLSRGGRNVANRPDLGPDNGGPVFAMDYGQLPSQNSTTDSRNPSKALSSIAVMFMDSVTQRSQNRISPLDSTSKISIVNPVGSVTTGGTAESSSGGAGAGDAGGSIWTWN